MPEQIRDNGRRNMIRGLVGGGAVAALAGPAVLRPAVARADAPAAPGGDPFALPAFVPSGRVREFWIQADSFEHNAVPNGMDAMMGRPYTTEQTTFWAVGFRAYTADWASPLDGDFGPEGIGANSGIPGPVLRAEVGDVVRVHFRNNDDHYRWPHSMHPHGVVYTPDNDGGWLSDDAQRMGSAVAYGESYTYTWLCHPSSAGTWPYHDHSVPQTPGVAGASTGSGSADAAVRHGRGGQPAEQRRDNGPDHGGGHDDGGADGGSNGGGHDGGGGSNGGGDGGSNDTDHAGGGQNNPGSPAAPGDSGAPAAPGDSGAPAGQGDSSHDTMVMEIGAELGLFGILVVTDHQTPSVDHEFVLFLHDLSKRSARSLALPLNMFNGGAFVDNTPTYTAKVGDRVRWRIAALGEEFHVFHIHGHRWRSRQGYQGWVDSQIVGPSTTLTIEYTEDNPGDWIYHCHVTHHMSGGMVGRYRVTA
ncbi:multicopper oxidase domain-containing protein [Kitasatospora sp. NBC_00315]|uniref:multicopper oxidase domain-containing protein n=1 Tax=Kitasatospora sp. NBC_00315 TaxID=2975963 RepID=UPI003246DF7F